MQSFKTTETGNLYLTMKNILSENWFFFKDFIYLFIDTERRAETQTEGEAPCREPDVGLDPGSP